MPSDSTQITSSLLESFLLCHRKAFLLTSGTPSTPTKALEVITALDRHYLEAVKNNLPAKLGQASTPELPFMLDNLRAGPERSGRQIRNPGVPPCESRPATPVRKPGLHDDTWLLPAPG